MSLVWDRAREMPVVCVRVCARVHDGFHMLFSWFISMHAMSVHGAMLNMIVHIL